MISSVPDRKTVLPVFEASITDLLRSLDHGEVTSVELVALYLNRIAKYDRHGTCLNSVPVLNNAVFTEARRSDLRRARGEKLGALEGIPYTAKDSYACKGMPIANGSPAFEHLIADHDAFTISRLRAAGAILLGLTNMPPMAAGGMERGLYGRAESPYNSLFLTSTPVSGSSNGGGTATAASFAAFGLGEETFSSGRGPASNNGLVAYTPSRGVISTRGNWPLVPTMDVVVPYSRTVEDMLEILDALVADDEVARGDFWRTQAIVSIPKASSVRPADYRTLRDPGALKGTRIGIPRMYINKDEEASSPIPTRASVINLWEDASRQLTMLGATIVEVDFPAVSNDERDRPGAQDLVQRGLVPAEFRMAEFSDLVIYAWDDFLQANGDLALNSLAQVDGQMIIPVIPGATANRFKEMPAFNSYPNRAQKGVPTLSDIGTLAEGLRGLVEATKVDVDDWMDQQRLDALVFPALADVAPFDWDYNEASSDIAWRNGTGMANGNQAIRRLGIPTVTVPMGAMHDTGMPVGLTFAGRAYQDNDLLRYAYAFESSGTRRISPPLTPELSFSGPDIDREAIRPSAPPLNDPQLAVEATVLPMCDDGKIRIQVCVTVSSSNEVADMLIFVNGQQTEVSVEQGGRFVADKVLPVDTHYHFHSRWRAPYGSLVTALAYYDDGAVIGAFTVAGGVK